MGVLDDVLKALDRVPIWKRLNEVPEEVDDLKRRVSELEDKLGGKWPADVCKFCGERTLRLYFSRPNPDKGHIHEEWQCSACNQMEKRLVKAK